MFVVKLRNFTQKESSSGKVFAVMSVDAFLRGVIQIQTHTYLIERKIIS